MEEQNQLDLENHKIFKGIQSFKKAFLNSFNTTLYPHEIEPLYQPSSSQNSPAIVFFLENHFSSLLHETAHFCLATQEQLQKEDYGFWYFPEGRTLKQQKLFEKVEVKPQALEWIFSDLCNHPFCVSADNFLEDYSLLPFEKAVKKQKELYLKNHQLLPQRASLFITELKAHFSPY